MGAHSHLGYPARPGWRQHEAPSLGVLACSSSLVVHTAGHPKHGECVKGGQLLAEGRADRTWRTAQCRLLHTSTRADRILFEDLLRRVTYRRGYAWKVVAVAGRPGRLAEEAPYAVGGAEEIVGA